MNRKRIRKEIIRDKSYFAKYPRQLKARGIPLGGWLCKGIFDVSAGITGLCSGVYAAYERADPKETIV